MGVKNSSEYCTVKGGFDMRENEHVECLAREIYRFLSERGMWGDTRIYFNGKAYCTGSVKKDGKQIGNNLFLIGDINPADYMDYYSRDTITMSFEGVDSMYEALNYGSDSWKIVDELHELLERHGYRFEQGNYWNLYLVELGDGYCHKET